MVERLFLAVPWGCLWFVIVVLTDRTHLLFLNCADGVLKTQLHLKNRKKAKTRNQYNHVPHLTKDTVGESNKNTRKHHKQKLQDVSLSH